MESDALQKAAAAVVARVPYCWLVTQSGARPMGRILAGPDWTLRFIADLRSRKMLEIEQSPAVQLIFQDSATDAFVALAGKAERRTDRGLWKDAYAAYFPTERDRANATFVQVQVDLMRLWIRGVTPEPFGLKPVVLERDGANHWSLQALDSQ
jgi:general stress protein 26